MKTKSVLLTLILILVPLSQMSQAQSATNHPDNVAKVKSEITKRVANKKTRVKIKLHDGGEVKGNIEQASDSGFTLTEDKAGKKLEMSYNSVEKVSGRGMSTVTKIGIVVGVAVVVVGVAVAVAIKNFDPFEGGITAR
jgi:cobalamin biosynthesis Mg chelatase CobN